MLIVEQAQKRFGRVTAVQDVSFSIPTKSTFGLLGPNGAGKTTTMRMILGILTPDGGSIRWNGSRIDERARRRFGYLPEERGLYGKMRVREHIAYFGRLHGIGSAESVRRADHWIERLALQTYATRPCAELSKGNQQKVQVACAAAHEPDLLILDEPFTGLDPVNADALYELLSAMQRKGTTLVLSSHEMWQLERLCTEYCIVSSGQTRAAGTLEDLRRGWPVRSIRVAPDASDVRSTLLAVDGARLRPANDGYVVADLPANTDLAALLRALVERNAVVAFEPLEPTLRDVYLRLVDE